MLPHFWLKYRINRVFVHILLVMHLKLDKLSCLRMFSMLYKF